MIAIIDYGMGNLGSVANACAFGERDASIIRLPAELDRCRAVILPGVGAFGDCMKHLDQHGFIVPLLKWIEAGRPFLGICLGLQVLYETSEESPDIPGLGVFPGSVRAFEHKAGLKIPQMGWNRVAQIKTDCPLFAGIPDQSYFYFVHSYYAGYTGEEWSAGRSDYGIEYTSAVWRESVMAVQFHPEKSQQLGLNMLNNFGEWMEHQ